MGGTDLEEGWVFVDTAVVGVVDVAGLAGADGGVVGGDGAYFMFA